MCRFAICVSATISAFISRYELQCLLHLKCRKKIEKKQSNNVNIHNLENEVANFNWKCVPIRNTDHKCHFVCRKFWKLIFNKVFIIFAMNNWLISIVRFQFDTILCFCSCSYCFSYYRFFLWLMLFRLEAEFTKLVLLNHMQWPFENPYFVSYYYRTQCYLKYLLNFFGWPNSKRRPVYTQ